MKIYENPVIPLFPKKEENRKKRKLFLMEEWQLINVEGIISW